MSAKTPLISVGMPVYNGERHIEEAINCILNQTLQDFELIISDNASSDSTEEICRDMAESDKRIKYIRNKTNIGAAANYNQLFHKCNTKYFRWFNADDLCAPELHQVCLNVMEENPDAVLCYGKTAMIDEKGTVTSHYEDNLNLQQEKIVDRYKVFFKSVGLTNIIYGLMRRSALKHTSLMGDSSFPAADTNFMAELTLYGKFIEIPETLFYRRMHNQASSWDRKNLNIQQKFWKGKDKAFRFPLWKKYFAYIHAISSAPIIPLEKMTLYHFILRLMIMERGSLAKEFWQEIRH